jgi:RNA recognition motif-containing protein
MQRKIIYVFGRRSGDSRGFAFVRFYNKHDAEDALDDLNGRLVSFIILMAG